MEDWFVISNWSQIEILHLSQVPTELLFHILKVDAAGDDAPAETKEWLKDEHVYLLFPLIMVILFLYVFDLIWVTT